MRQLRGPFVIMMVGVGAACGGNVEPTTSADASVDGADDAFDTRPTPRPDVGVDSACECPTALAAADHQPCACPGQSCGDCGVISCYGGFWHYAECNPPGLTGAPCTDDSTCVGFGDVTRACSNGLFLIGTLEPSPVCMNKGCVPGDDTTVFDCDRGTGVCLTTSGGGLCLPACTFSNDGAAPLGCVGKNRCQYLHTREVEGALLGIGYCLGGCTADSDCTKDDVCQLESSYCVKKRLAYSKPLGALCTKADSASDDGCNCALTDATQGYCTRACAAGLDTCPTGFSCDAQLPRIGDAGAEGFSLVPLGLGGRCLKNCEADADCATFGPSKCVESAGVGRKTCQVLASR